MQPEDLGKKAKHLVEIISVKMRAIKAAKYEEAMACIGTCALLVPSAWPATFTEFNTAGSLAPPRPSPPLRSQSPAPPGPNPFFAPPVEKRSQVLIGTYPECTLLSSSSYSRASAD
eukprot:6210028-Pleurochrysis_carterae.AAC.6